MEPLTFYLASVDLPDSPGGGMLLMTEDRKVALFDTREEVESAVREYAAGLHATAATLFPVQQEPGETKQATIDRITVNLRKQVKHDTQCN